MPRRDPKPVVDMPRLMVWPESQVDQLFESRSSLRDSQFRILTFRLDTPVVLRPGLTMVLDAERVEDRLLVGCEISYDRQSKRYDGIQPGDSYDLQTFCGLVLQFVSARLDRQSDEPIGITLALYKPDASLPWGPGAISHLPPQSGVPQSSKGKEALNA